LSREVQEGAFVGTTYFIQPIAPVEADTVRVPAGVVTFGLEMRQLTPSIVSQFYEEPADALEVQGLIEQAGALEDGGLSIHVCDTDDGLEYLRFDCFRNAPHYHYLHPHEEWQVVHEIDPVAVGDPFEWIIGRINTRLAEMLVESGAAGIASSLDASTIALALNRLRDLRVAALAAGAP
jgi:hypothetical protein